MIKTRNFKNVFLWIATSSMIATGAVAQTKSPFSAGATKITAAPVGIQNTAVATQTPTPCTCPNTIGSGTTLASSAPGAAYKLQCNYRVGGTDMAGTCSGGSSIASVCTALGSSWDNSVAEDGGYPSSGLNLASGTPPSGSWYGTESCSGAFGGPRAHSDQSTCKPFFTVYKLAQWCR